MIEAGKSPHDDHPENHRASSQQNVIAEITRPHFQSDLKRGLKKKNSCGPGQGEYKIPVRWSRATRDRFVTHGFLSFGERGEGGRGECPTLFHGCKRIWMTSNLQRFVLGVF